MDRLTFQRAWGKVVARAWADAAFKARVLAAPEAVFREYGFEAPPNILIRVDSKGDRMIRLRCTRRGAPEWYLECTSSSYRQPETSSHTKLPS
jgi:hypothetical protein